MNTTGDTSGAGTAYPELIPGFWWGSCYSILSFLCISCRSLIVLFYFLFWPLLCLFVCLFVCFFVCLCLFLFFFRYTDSDHPFGIFKLFLKHTINTYLGVSILPLSKIFIFEPFRQCEVFFGAILKIRIISFCAFFFKTSPANLYEDTVVYRPYL